MLKFFLFGAVGYPLLELLYRKRTHYSMAVAGGISASAIAAVQQLPCSLKLRSLISAICITGIEYAVGRIWNRTYRVWDYRKLPCNYKGQICLPFFLVWGMLSLVCISFLDRLKTR